MPNRLDRDQGSVWADLVSNCLQSLSADDTKSKWSNVNVNSLTQIMQL